MYRTLFASAALLGLLGGVAHAQTAPTTAAPMAPAQPTTAAPMAPAHPTTAAPVAPAHRMASARLPVPPLSENATPAEFLMAAQDYLRHGQQGLAEEALERAETRLLDRSTWPSAADQPDNAPVIHDIVTARTDLGEGNLPGAETAVMQALPLAGGHTGA
jgi:hypothetical protein